MDVYFYVVKNRLKVLLILRAELLYLTQRFVCMYIYVKMIFMLKLCVDLRARTQQRVANRHGARSLAFKVEK